MQPLVAVALGLRERGYTLSCLGDTSVAAAMQSLGFETVILPDEHDLGPVIIAAVRDSLALPQAQQGELVEQRLSAWAGRLEPVVRDVIRKSAPDLLVTSLFGVQVAHLATFGSNLPWAVVNSTFYVGPNPPRPLEDDIAPRALPLFRNSLVPLLDHANLVLHATDRVFDYDHLDLPPRHHYVGPLLWEPLAAPRDYLSDAGDPWVLVTLSSQLQDDVPLARMALDALADVPVRVLATIGPGHQPDELEPLPGNARVVQYAPHAPVLQQSRLFISHAGHGAVMKALWYGVPMVLVPWGRDQPGVAARAERLGVARVIARDQLSEPVLTNAIRDVIGSTRYQENALAFSRHLQACDSVATACEYLRGLGNAT